MYKIILHAIFFLLSTSLVFSQTGPGGVGTNDGTSNLVLWVKYDAGVEEANGDDAEVNDNVQFWRDQSGYGNDLTQNTSDDQPVFTGNSIQFSGDASASSTGDYFNLTGINAQTIIIVIENLINVPSTTHGLFSQVHGGSSVYYHISSGGYKISFDGTLSETGSYAVNGETLSASAENHGSSGFTSEQMILYGQYDNQISNLVYFAALDNGNGPQYRGNHEIKEVIVFDDQLSACERTQVEVYLADKYGITYDLFDESASGSNGVQTDIAGIVKQGGSDITSATSSTVTISDINFLKDYSDAIFIAHSNLFGVNSIDIPGSIDTRKTNYWFADYSSCSSNTGNVLLSFDLSGLAPADVSSYRLLTSVSTTFSAATISTSPVLNGSSIEFTVDATFLNDVYFTLGTTDSDVSPLIQGPEDIADGIVLWLKNDAGIEEASGDVAETDDLIEYWLDQSGNDNHASMIGASKPTYNGSAVSFTGDASATTTGEYLDLPSISARTIIGVFDNAQNNVAGTHGIMGQSTASSPVYLHLLTTDGITMSFDGKQSETGRVSLNGQEFSATAENITGDAFPSTATIAYMEYSALQSNMDYLAAMNTGSGIQYRANYDLKEFIVYDRLLTDCEKRNLEAYLSGKHSLDQFVQNYSAPNTSFVNDIGLIQDRGVYSNLQSDTSGNLIVEDVDFLTDIADAIGFAHHGEGGTSKDVPATCDVRMSNIWYLDYYSCNGNNGDIKLRFLVDGGDCGSISPAIAENYKLLYNYTSTMASATVLSGATINGNYVEFTINTSVVADMYITLATIDANASLIAEGPANITEGLTLWLKADCGIEEAEDDPAETNDGVFKWNDQSGGSNHATQISSADRPIYDGTKVQFSGDASATTNGEYFDLPAIEGQTIIAVVENLSDGAGGGIHALVGLEPSSNYTDIFLSSQELGYAASFDGDNGDQGRLGITGTELTSAGTSGGSTNYPDSLSIMYAEYTSNFSEWIYLGAFRRSDNVAYRGNYDLHEVIVFNRELSCEERNELEKYLADKYSIALYYNETEKLGDNGINTDPILVEDGNTTAISSAVTIENGTFINDCTDSLSIAHDNGSGLTLKADDADMSGLAGTEVVRWTRMWYALAVSNAIASGNVTITFDLDDYPVSANETVAGTSYALITSASPWAYATTVSGPTINTSNNTVSFVVAADQINKKKFTLATTDNVSSPLPVELIYFNAYINNDKVEIDWRTATETDNDFFAVQRSFDLVNWETIKIVDGTGNSNESHDYHIIDDVYTHQTQYYRLEQTDLDGRTTLSHVETINVIDLQKRLVVYPNPVENLLNIQGNTSELAQVKVLNSLAIDVTTLCQLTFENQQKLIIDMTSLEAGIYFIKTNTSIHKLTKK